MVPDKVESIRLVEQEFGVFMRRIQRILDQRARTIHPDLSATNYWILASLQGGGPTRASFLVEAFDLDKGAVSRYVSQLATLGLITRQPDPSDGRAQLISLTELGRSKLEAVVNARRQNLAEKFDEWSDEELHSLATLLHRYNRTAETALD
jgi:DNA-binding MarR family transcriptional regulator